MSKLLLAFSVAALLYGDCALGMNSDEIDQESTADYSSQNWPFKSEKKETRLERQKRQLRQLNAELKRNQLATDSKNLEEKTEKREITPKEDLSEKSNFPPNKQQSDLINLQREKIAKYESALQKLNQQLNEEREKNKKAEAREREQKIKIEKLMKLLDDVKSKIKTNKIVEKNLASDSKQDQKPMTRLERQKQQLQQLNKNLGQNQIEIKELKKQFRKYELQPNFVISEKQKIQKSSQEQLFEAIRSGSLADVSNAIKNGADVKTNANVLEACWSGNLEIVRYLVKHGADVNKVRNDDGVTPLLIAAQEGYGNIVKFLVEHGADINKAENNEQTPLYTASMNGHFEIVKFLIEHGADINKTNIWKNTPLHAAFFNKHETVIKYLMKHGADINAKNILGLTPLQSTELSNMLLGENNRNKRKEAK